MKDLRQVVPPKREILRGIWLSFRVFTREGDLVASVAQEGFSRLT